MRFLLITLLALTTLMAAAQQRSFPESWEGNWKGVLEWHHTGNDTARKINMELRIHKGNDAGTWTWQIIYGSEAEDNRPYKLIQKDNSGTHWVIDENSGIVLDQYWVANRFAGAFTVLNSTIFNSYRMENNKLVVEFYTVGAKPVSTTGQGTEDNPTVYSYPLNGYQKAVLTREK